MIGMRMSIGMNVDMSIGMSVDMSIGMMSVDMSIGMMSEDTSMGMIVDKSIAISSNRANRDGFLWEETMSE